MNSERLVIALVVLLVALASLITYVRDHRRPKINMSLPQTQEEMQTPPDLFPVQPHDIKG